MGANIPRKPPAVDQGLLDSLVVIPGVHWYHLSDPYSDRLDALATHFGIHPLQIEDCRHRRQRARVEEHENYTFIVIKVLAAAFDDKHASRGTSGDANREPAGSAKPKNVSTLSQHSQGKPADGNRLRFDDFDIFLGPGYVLTVSDGESTLVSSVHTRVAAMTGPQSPDRIVYSLMDWAVDGYLPALDHLGDTISRLEDRVIRNPVPSTLHEIFRLKRTLLDFRRVATAMREATNGIVRRYDAPPAVEGELVDRELRFYYRDVYEHVARVIDLIEAYRDLLSGSLDIYLSAVANRTNEIMKILTLWGTIAMPLLVLTSFYGMNVELPFQKDPRALVILGLIMAASTLLMFIYIRRKHWF